MNRNEIASSCQTVLGHDMLVKMLYYISKGTETLSCRSLRLYLPLKNLTFVVAPLTFIFGYYRFTHYCCMQSLRNSWIFPGLGIYNII